MEKGMKDLPKLLREIAGNLAGADEFLFRDILDLARLGISRVQNYGLSSVVLAMESWRNGKTSGERVKSLLKELLLNVELEYKVVSASPEYSLYESLKLLQAKHETNPDFEKTLKANSENAYCRSCITEFFPTVYLPQMECYVDYITQKINADDRGPWERPECFDTVLRACQEKFYSEPLANVAPDCAKARKALKKNLERLADNAEKIINLSSPQK
jgi:hypothetical protein